MRRALLLVGTAIALCASANAEAGKWDGQISGGYTYTDISAISDNLNTFNIGGIAKYDFGQGWNAQADFDYSRLTVADNGLDNFIAGGAVFWRNNQYAVGGYGFFNDYSEDGDFYYGTFGGLAEWYATPHFTLRGNLGGIVIEGETGIIGGGGASAYVIPDLSLNLDVDVNNIAGLTWYDVRVGADYLISHEVPLVLGVGYTYSNYSEGSLTANAFMVRLTWRLGDSGSLVDLDRSGPMKLPKPDFLPL